LFSGPPLILYQQVSGSEAPRPPSAMQYAKPLLILSVTLAANNDIQTPAVEVLNKASFAYGSTLGLQRSRKLTQNLVDSVQLEQMKDTTASSSLGLEDVSVLGFQRSFTVTKRAAPDLQTTKTAVPVEDDMQDDAAQQTDSQISAGNPMRSTLGLEDVSVLGLQRAFTVTKRASLPSDLTPKAAPPTEDPDVEPTLEDVSVLGLQRAFTVTKRASLPSDLTPKAAPPTEDPDVEPTKGMNMVSSTTDFSIAGASLLGRQKWTHLSRGQSSPTEDTDDSQYQEGNGTGNSNVSLLGLQKSWKLSQRPAVIDDTEDSALVPAPYGFEMDLSFEDVSVLGLQRSVHVKSRAIDPTSNNSKDAVLGLQRSKKLIRGQVAPIEEDIESMVMKV